VSIKKPLVLGNGRVQQLQPADQLSVEDRVERLERLFRRLLISCAMQGVEMVDEELQAEFALAMAEHN
jgi:hypothetical protein